MKKSWHGFDCISILPGSDEGEQASRVFDAKNANSQNRRLVLVGNIGKGGARKDQWITTSSSPQPITLPKKPRLHAPDAS